MFEYRLRVDGLTDDRIEAFLKRFCERYLLVHHTTQTENPHYHAYLQTHMTAPNFSKYIKKHLEVSGSEYSNKVCNADRKDDYLSYLFNTKKGNVSRFVSSEGIPELVISKAKENAESITTAYENTKKKYGSKSQFQIVVKAIEQIRGDKRLFNPATIYDEIVQLSKKYGKIIRYGQMRDMVQTAMAFSDDKQCEDYARQQHLSQYGDWGQSTSISASITYYK